MLASKFCHRLWKVRRTAHELMLDWLHIVTGSTRQSRQPGNHKSFDTDNSKAIIAA